jgi:N-acetylglutamate synthase-like GNAT family acetyltransferase
MEIKTPVTEKEWKAYYALRYEVLRAPWNQPLGSEKDDKEDQGHHLAAFDRDKIIGVGRLDSVDAVTGQIRFMAVAPHQQGRGVGAAVIEALEMEAWKQGKTQVILHAREVAVDFYAKAGYQMMEKSHLLFGEIQHFLMQKKKG